MLSAVQVRPTLARFAINRCEALDADIALPLSSASGHPAPPQTEDPDAAVRYLDAMCTGTPDGLLAVSGKQNCLDLCVTVQEYIRDTRWELGETAPPSSLRT